MPNRKQSSFDDKRFPEKSVAFGLRRAGRRRICEVEILRQTFLWRIKTPIKVNCIERKGEMRLADSMLTTVTLDSNIEMLDVVSPGCSRQNRIRVRTFKAKLYFNLQDDR